MSLVWLAEISNLSKWAERQCLAGIEVTSHFDQMEMIKGFFGCPNGINNVPGVENKRKNGYNNSKENFDEIMRCEMLQTTRNLIEQYVVEIQNIYGAHIRQIILLSV